MVRPNLFAYSTSGRLFDDGGEKIHVFDWETGRILCGRHLVGSCVAEVTQDWLVRADKGRVCKLCLKKARRILGDFGK